LQSRPRSQVSWSKIRTSQHVEKNNQIADGVVDFQDDPAWQDSSRDQAPLSSNKLAAHRMCKGNIRNHWLGDNARRRSLLILRNDSGVAVRHLAHLEGKPGTDGRSALIFRKRPVSVSPISADTSSLGFNFLIAALQLPSSLL